MNASTPITPSTPTGLIPSNPPQFASDLKRGLLGHVFNGYDEAHVKDELKPVMARFRSGETQEKRVTLDGPKLSDDELRALEQAGSHA